jgi:hypothetical protein
VEKFIRSFGRENLEERAHLGGGIILKCMDRIQVVRDRDQRRDITTIMNRGGSKKFWVFLE